MERVPQRQRKGQAGAAENTEVLVASGACFDLALRVFHGELKKTFFRGKPEKRTTIGHQYIYIYMIYYIYYIYLYIYILHIYIYI